MEIATMLNEQDAHAEPSLEIPQAASAPMELDEKHSDPLRPQRQRRPPKRMADDISKEEQDTEVDVKKKPENEHLKDLEAREKYPPQSAASECPIFYPTPDDLKDPVLYLEGLKQYGEKFGMIKLVMPMEWSDASLWSSKREEAPDKLLDTSLQAMKQKRISRIASGRLAWAFQFSFIQVKSESLDKMQKCSDERRRKTLGQSNDAPQQVDDDNLEALYWNGLNYDSHFEAPFQDQPGTFFVDNRLCDQISKPSLLQVLEEPVEGVSEPAMLYVGTFHSSSAWHIEDDGLHSISYMHTGDPKVWYSVPAAASMEVEDVVFRTFSAKNKRDRSSPDAFLGRKTTMFTPHLLASGNSTIPVYRTIQQPGEMIVTFPRAYQAAVSLGFNVSEAINFALSDWTEHAMLSLASLRLLACSETVSDLDKRASCLDLEKMICDACVKEEHRCVKQHFLPHFQLLATWQTAMLDWAARDGIQSNFFDDGQAVAVVGVVCYVCLHRLHMVYACVLVDGQPCYACAEHMHNLSDNLANVSLIFRYQTETLQAALADGTQEPADPTSSVERRLARKLTNNGTMPAFFLADLHQAFCDLKPQLQSWFCDGHGLIGAKMMARHPSIRTLSADDPPQNATVVAWLPPDMAGEGMWRARVDDGSEIIVDLRAIRGALVTSHGA